MEQHFRQLIDKYLTNSLTAAEQEELTALSRLPENRALLETMIEADLREHAFAGEEDLPLKQQLFEQLEARIAASEAAMRVMRPRRGWLRWAAAAALITAVAAGWWWGRTPGPVQMAKHAVNDAAPGGNKATLTLADGTTIALDDSAAGNLATQGGVTVVKLDSGRLAYKGSGEAVINTISTPRGGQYQVILPDGTKVWLNSASSLQFPTAFSGAERQVTLTGEGYFEVTENTAQPFRVNTGATTVQVLGTSFNIMSYDNEPQQHTTLVEGAVKLSTPGLAQVLRPGEQAVLSYRSGRVQVKTVDVEEAVAWKNGRFRFVKQPIDAIMRQIERWYNVEVELKGDLSQVVLSGMVSRREYVSQLLEALEETGDVHFTMNGNHITVYPGGK